MKNKNFQIWQINSLRPLSVKFISKNGRKYGKSANILLEVTTQSIQQHTNKTRSKFDEK